MKRVTGIGGIFFKCKDPKATTAWYQKHLGLDTNPYGATFEWYEKQTAPQKPKHNGHHLHKTQNTLTRTL